MNSIAGILVVSMLFSSAGTGQAPEKPSNQPTIQSTENLIIFEETKEERQALLEKQKKIEEEAQRIEVEKSKAALNALDFDYDIASYTTNYSQSSANANRNYNMLLASDSINGTVLNPGETFSYNDVILSHRTAQRDYVAAGVISNGKIVNGVGGGICQISSTLYNAALYSGMTITQRRNHSLKVGYLPAGRDATASWGSIDFCFRNDLDRPVKIESVMANGVIKIRFLSPGNPNIGEVKLVVTQNNGSYYLNRYINGVVNYTATSHYK